MIIIIDNSILLCAVLHFHPNFYEQQNLAKSFPQRYVVYATTITRKEPAIHYHIGTFLGINDVYLRQFDDYNDRVDRMYSSGFPRVFQQTLKVI